jgi:hypothetical protein
VTAVSGSGGSRWLPWAAAVVDAFPLSGTDWVAHSDAVEGGLYSVRGWAMAQAGQPSTDAPAQDETRLF